MTTSPVMGITEEILGEIERAGWKLVPVERIQIALEAVQNAMLDAYSNAYQECCGRGQGQCCGDPDPAWSAEDQRIMDALSPAQRELSALLAAAPAAPVARFLPDLPDQMARDLARFNETCEDGQGYDVPKERMRSMARFGLVRWCGGSRFEITDCGIAALEAMAAPPAAEQPDTVVVPRELLDRAATWLEVHAPSGGSVEGDVADDLRALLAGGAE